MNQNVKTTTNIKLKQQAWHLAITITQTTNLGSITTMQLKVSF